MLFHNYKLNRLLFGAFVIALAVPTINVFLIYPHFSQLLTSQVENSAVRMAQHLEHLVQANGGWEAILQDDNQTAVQDVFTEKYLSDLSLEKMKIFSAQGLAVFSTDEADIGKINTNSYFKNYVVKGQLYSKVVKKQTKSLEGDLYQRDVIEIYVPFSEKDPFSGAFELYYDITQQVTSLDKLILYASILPFAVSGFLIFAIYWGLRNLDKSLLENKKSQEEIEALQGIVPICMYCKGIRDDKGYWNKLEAYIEERSDAQFSHGICDECMEEKYGPEVTEKVKKASSRKKN